MMQKEYLGDGVYADVRDGGIMLTTENGIAVQNEVFFEPEVLAAFWEYCRRVGVRL